MTETEIIPKMGFFGIGCERALMSEILGKKHAGQGPNRVNTAKLMFQKWTGFLEPQGDYSEPGVPRLGEQAQGIVALTMVQHRIPPVQGGAQEINEVYRDL